jgi:hypothetical protein
MSRFFLLGLLISILPIISARLRISRPPGGNPAASLVGEAQDKDRAQIFRLTLRASELRGSLFFAQPILRASKQ